MTKSRDHRITKSPNMSDITTVVAAVIERDGRLLITRRQPGVHLEGYWEFPGGKSSAGETLAEALEREIREELDCMAAVGEKIFETVYQYPDRSVRLHFFKCTLSGVPRPRLGQQMRWASRSELKHLPFPPADAELIEKLAASVTNSTTERL